MRCEATTGVITIQNFTFTGIAPQHATLHIDGHTVQVHCARATYSAHNAGHGGAHCSTNCLSGRFSSAVGIAAVGVVAVVGRRCAAIVAVGVIATIAVCRLRLLLMLIHEFLSMLNGMLSVCRAAAHRSRFTGEACPQIAFAHWRRTVHTVEIIALQVQLKRFAAIARTNVRQ